jgi:hypothetical protein
LTDIAFGCNFGHEMVKRISIALCLAAALGSTAFVAAAGAGTTGDVSYSVTWKKGPGANQTTLIVKNTAAQGGETISDFYFQISGTATITDVTGGNCTPYNDLELFCGNALDPGQSETIVITTDSALANGTDATITFDDNAEAGQPPVTVKLGSTRHHHHKRKHHRRKHHHHHHT